MLADKKIVQVSHSYSEGSTVTGKNAIRKALKRLYLVLKTPLNFISVMRLVLSLSGLFLIKHKA